MAVPALDGLGAVCGEFRDLYRLMCTPPELSFQETRTAGVMAARAEAYGYEVASRVGRTGAAAVLGDGDKSVALLRVDFGVLFSPAAGPLGDAGRHLARFRRDP